jgi:hypothetical protein
LAAVTRRGLVQRSLLGGAAYFAGGAFLLDLAIEEPQRALVRVVAAVGAGLCFVLSLVAAVQAARAFRGSYDERLRRR